MKRRWNVRLAYRRKSKPEADIHYTVFTAHSIQDAKVRFNAWQIREWNEIRYVVLAGAKMEEVSNVQTGKNNR